MAPNSAPRAGRNLATAVVVGLALAAVVLLSLLIDKRWFVVVGSVLAMVVVYEIGTAMNRAGRPTPVTVAVGMTGAIVYTLGIMHALQLWLPLSMFALLLAASWVGLLRPTNAATPPQPAALTPPPSAAPPQPESTPANTPTHASHRVDIAVSTAMYAYVTACSAALILVLIQGRGQWWVLMTIAVAVAADTGAFFVGRSFGRHQLAPRISPNKTWEGFFGGLAFGTAVATGAAVWLLELPWWYGAGGGILLTLVGALGDLLESQFKRWLGLKDISQLLPGHGGIFDRVDSILPAAPVALGLYFLATRVLEFAPWRG